MTVTSTKPANEIVEVTLESAYEQAELLQNRSDYIADGATIIQGIHPEHGQVVIVIPPIGNSVVIPVMPMMIRNASDSPVLLPMAA